MSASKDFRVFQHLLRRRSVRWLCTAQLPCRNSPDSPGLDDSQVGSSNLGTASQPKTMSVLPHKLPPCDICNSRLCHDKCPRSHHHFPLQSPRPRRSTYVHICLILAILFSVLILSWAIVDLFNTTPGQAEIVHTAKVASNETCHWCIIEVGEEQKQWPAVGYDLTESYGYFPLYTRESSPADSRIEPRRSSFRPARSSTLAPSRAMTTTRTRCTNSPSNHQNIRRAYSRLPSHH